MSLFGTLLSLALSLYIGSSAASQGKASPITVNPELLAFHQRFATPTLYKVSERVYAAFAFEYSNFTFIEGDSGVIVIDTGWYPGGMKRALAEFRKISDKPVVALLYTHSHLDHTGASEVLLAETDGKPIAVYAPGNWQHYLQYSQSPMRPMVARRAFAQMGTLLPRGPQGTVGVGVGPTPGVDGKTGFLPPTVEVVERTSINIAGVDMEIIPTQGDIPEHMMIWLPEEKVLMTGDLLGGTFPYVESARYEPDRDPQAMVDSLDIALALQPESVVPGHGRLLLGKKDSAENLLLNRDLIQYLVDQVDRAVIQGMNADQLVDSFVLPAPYANHPDLQPHYHRVEWMLRGMYMKRAGWNGDIVDLVGPGEQQESARLVDLLGGPDQVLAAVGAALGRGENRWAAGLSHKVLQTEPGNQGAQQMFMAALHGIAVSTDSANERNYILTELAERSGKLDWTPIIENIRANDLKLLSSLDMLREMKTRINPRAAEALIDTPIMFHLQVEGEAGNYSFGMRNSVLIVNATPSGDHAQLSLSRDSLNKLYIGKLKWSGALSQGLVNCSANCDSAAAVMSTIE